ncbi:SANTA (SANT associated) domain-containing protein [Ditylenchus destructor]|nr:SANTA (SANT associated) domain-containing protein [Ditylenchus destructor]
MLSIQCTRPGTSSTQRPPTELKYWIFRFVDFSPNQVCVQGYVTQKTEAMMGQKIPYILKCVTSSSISKRFGARHLVTIRGREYVLKGTLDVDQALLFSYSEDIIEAFKSGFPEDWRHQLQREYNRMQPSPQPSPLNTVARMAQKDVQLASGDSGGLKVSRRSGRVLKQPLQSWTGERIVYDVDGNPVAAHAPTTKAPSRPDVDERLAAICDGLGVNRLEPSKQTHRLSLNSLPDEKKKRRSTSKVAPKSSKRRKKLVDYSSSDADSYLQFVDQVPLSPSPSRTQRRRREKTVNTPFPALTPIPHKYLLKNRRHIFSSEGESDSDKENEELLEYIAQKPKKKTKPNEKPKQAKTPNVKKEKAPPKQTKKKEQTGRNWTEEQLKYLKIAVGAAGANPKFTGKLDWNQIAKLVGKCTPEECLEQAIEMKLVPKSLKAPSKPGPKPGPSKKARARDSSVSSSEESDDSFMAKIDKVQLPQRQIKATKAKNVKTPAKKTKNVELAVVNYSDSDNESRAPPVEITPKQTPKPRGKSKVQTPKVGRRWTDAETQRLKSSLKIAGNPQTDQDWETVAQTVGTINGPRTAQECRDQAAKIRWKPQIGNQKPAKQPHTVDEEDDGANKPTSSKTPQNKNENLKRNRSMAEPDFFLGAGRDDDITRLDLDPDDSLLDALRTPEEEVKFMRKPFIMRVLNETRHSKASNDSRNSSFYD